MEVKARLLVYTAVILLLVGLAFFVTSRFKPAGPRISNITTTILATKTNLGCFEIPANPTKQQVISLIGMAYNGSECAIAAIRAYYSSGLLSRYNLTVNMTKLSALTSNGIAPSNGIYS